jgi:hypothetical protein
MPPSKSTTAGTAGLAASEIYDLRFTIYEMGSFLPGRVSKLARNAKDSH